MFDSLVKKLSRHGPVQPAALQALQEIMTPPKRFDGGQEIIRQFSDPKESTLVLTGLAARLVTLEDGEQQLTALHLAGDFVDLHSFVLHRMDHGIVALTKCTVSTAPHGALARVTERYPELGRALWFLTVVDAAVHRRWLTVIGLMDARERAAHLFCEMWVRFHDVGLTDGLRFHLPMTQGEIANVLCMSTVHVNRVLQDLRSERLISWQRGRIEIRDWDRLANLARFEPTYLQVGV